MGDILRVNDGLKFKVKLDFLEKYFDIHAHRRATYPINTGMYTIVGSNGERRGNWVLWCPNENENDSGCTNIVSQDGTTITETGGDDYLHSDSIENKRYKIPRVVFSKAKDGLWVFRGVFIPDYEQSVYSGSYVKNVFVRIATEIEIVTKPGKMRILDDSPKEIKPLNVIKITEKPANDAEYVSDVTDTLKEIKEISKYTPIPEDAPKKAKTSNGEKYPRDPKNGAVALLRADFQCEFNPEHESFIKASDGMNYTEAHHLVPMAQQGLFKNSLDTPANIVSLCCTCHRCIHLGTDKAKKIMLFNLYNDRKEELKKTGIMLTFEDLFKMY